MDGRPSWAAFSITSAPIVCQTTSFGRLRSGRNSIWAKSGRSRHPTWETPSACQRRALGETTEHPRPVRRPRQHLDNKLRPERGTGPHQTRFRERTLSRFAGLKGLTAAPWHAPAKPHPTCRSTSTTPAPYGRQSSSVARRVYTPSRADRLRTRP